jgi:hypothetical protein
MEWFQSGYYQQKNGAVAKQFLVDSMFSMKDAKNYSTFKVAIPENASPGLMASLDTVVGCQHYPLIETLTLGEFADAKIDVIMVTTSDMQEPWLKLQKELKPKAKLLREEGNVIGWASLHPEYNNLLTSDFPTYRQSVVPNKVLYHQKFDTEKVFVYEEPKHFDRITCFMPGFRSAKEIEAFTSLHDFGGMEFADYGHGSKRGFLSPKHRFVEEMVRTALVWHVKPGGDGFGHVIHSSLAMGRPVVTVADDYYGGQAWPLLLDGKTCILIGKDATENSKKLKLYQDPDVLLEMSHAARDRFRSVVDYGWEKGKIADLLGKLI